MIDWLIRVAGFMLFFWIMRKIYSRFLKGKFFQKSKTVKMRVNKKELAARRKRMLILLPILILILASVSFGMYQWRLKDYFSGEAMTINEFQEKLDSDAAIERLVVLDNTWSITWEDGTINRVNVLYGPIQKFVFYTDLSRDAEVIIKPPITASILIPCFMILCLIGFFVIIVFWWPKVMGMTFIKTTIKGSEEWSKIKFSDVAAVDEAKEELLGIIEFLRNPQQFTSLGAIMPKGILLQGPPGCGKTLLARALAGEAEVPFYSMSGSEFVEMYVGVGASRVKSLFKKAKNNAPCIIFIDEIDAFGRQRSNLPGILAPREEESTLNQLLTEMDGFNPISGVLVLAATNRPDILDSALLRPGRFDSKITISPPNRQGREEILKVHTRNKPLASDVDLAKIAAATPGLTGADLANIVNEAALQAADKKRKEIQQKDFEFAIEKVTMGETRKSLVLSEEEKIATAYHEAGHALVAHYSPAADSVQKVSIIPRYRSLGMTKFLPLEEHYILTKEQALTFLSVLLGGRAAENIVLNLFSTGAASDIARATQLAKEMICQYGMSEKLGTRTIREDEFYYQMTGQGKNFSEITAKAIDEEVDKLIQESFEIAKKILQENREKLELLKNALLETEEIDREKFLKIINGGSSDDSGK